MGVVEPPNAPNGGTVLMFWLLYVLNYLIGALLMTRIATLRLRDKYERRMAYWRDQVRYGSGRPEWYAYVWGIIPLVVFWPIVVLALASWKLIFPRGVKTQFAKERELEAALKRAREEAADRDKQIQDLEKEVRTWTPGRPANPPRGYRCPACEHSINVHREGGCDVDRCDCFVPWGQMAPGDPDPAPQTSEAR